ncbi:MAG: DUF6328 family protein [Burkholderiales bacterium]
MALERPAGIGRKQEISLDTAASYLIEECRMVIPGVQALFGFQLICVFNQGFEEKLSEPAQFVHLVALVLTALAMALVMTPAAVHRIAEPMSVSERFLWMASNLLLAGMVSLAIGVAIDVFVVTTALTSSNAIGIALGVAALLVFAVLWLFVPRREREPQA